MLSEKQIIANIPTVDLSRAVDFYTNKLGLKPERASDMDAGFSAGMGSMLDLYQKGQANTESTSVSFIVDDLEAEMDALKEEGIKFEEYDLPDMGIKTVDGVSDSNGTKMAWFKDSEGNILALIQM